MSNNFLDIVAEEFPFDIRKHIVPAIHKGYEMFNFMVINNPPLSSYMGSNVHGHLRGVCVTYAIEETVEINKLPIALVKEKNKNNGYKTTEFMVNRAIISVNQVQKITDIPRVSKLRQQRSVANTQMCFPHAYDGLEKRIEDPFAPYNLIITHGARGLIPDFVCLGAPVPGEQKWIDYMYLHTEQVEVKKAEVEEIQQAVVKLNIKLREERGALGDG